MGNRWTSERIRLLREALGYSRRELGVALECPRDRVAAWENGKATPSPWFQRRLDRLAVMVLSAAEEMRTENDRRMP